MNETPKEDFINWEETGGELRCTPPEVAKSANKKARGYFWEAIYSRTVEIPSIEAELDCLTTSRSRIEGSTGYNNRIIKTGKNLSKITDKLFDTCDFSAEYANFTFKECRFTNCNFNKGKWQSVKFTGCHFTRCNFAFSDFIGCIFRDCKFDQITVSSDHLVFERTSIGSTAFMNAIYTNTSYLPSDYSVDTQNYHLIHTKSKVAQSILQSTQGEADQDLFFEAYKERTLRWLDWKIHRGKYLEASDAKAGKPIRRNSTKAFLISIVPRVEYYITHVSGFLTDWGRSIMRPLSIMFVLTAIMTAVYYLSITQQYHAQEYTVILAAQRAIDVSLVAGYTKYAPGATNVVDVSGGWLSYLTTVHMLVGLFWYALIVPVVVRRILR